MKVAGRFWHADEQEIVLFDYKIDNCPIGSWSHSGSWRFIVLISGKRTAVFESEAKVIFGTHRHAALYDPTSARSCMLKGGRQEYQTLVQYKPERNARSIMIIHRKRTILCSKGQHATLLDETCREPQLMQDLQAPHSLRWLSMCSNSLRIGAITVGN